MYPLYDNITIFTSNHIQLPQTGIQCQNKIFQTGFQTPVEKHIKQSQTTFFIGFTNKMSFLILRLSIPNEFKHVVSSSMGNISGESGRLIKNG